MNMEKLKQAIEIAKMLDGSGEMASGADGRFVIVRSRDAGVLFGNYDGNQGSTVKLRNAVQMWKWKAAKGGTLADCAEFGVDASECKFSFARATVTIFNACALIDCTDVAAKSIASVQGGEWK
jgi:hypothetical protein